MTFDAFLELREFIDDIAPQAMIHASCAIHVTENGYARPTPLYSVQLDSPRFIGAVISMPPETTLCEAKAMILKALAQPADPPSFVVHRVGPLGAIA